MRPKISESQVSFKKKVVAAETPIRQMNKSQVSATSQMDQARSQKSLSQGHSRVGLRSGNPLLIEKMDQLPEDMVKLKRQNAQLRIMELSEDARQSLMKLQRFDRFIFPMESERILKKPIEQQLRRLQKIKNQQVEMRGMLYDNELTITALYNHIKLIFEMNRELQERQVLRKEKDEAVRKMHEQKRQSLKQVRQLKEQMRLGVKSLTPIKVDKGEQEAPQTTPLKKEQITTLNFISATLRGKKYAEAIEEIKKFISKSSSTQPEACRLMQMFLPALEDQLTTLVQTKTVETKITEINVLIEKTNKEIRVNHFDQLQKIKNEALKSNSAYKNIGLLLESILNMKKMDDADKNKKGPATDSRSIDKVSQRLKTIEDELKVSKQQLFKERAANAENLKAKQAIEKQLEKLKADFERAQLEIQNYKKIQIEQKKVVSKGKNPEDQIKSVRQELNAQRCIKVNLEKEIQKLQGDIQVFKKAQVETKKITARTKQTEDQTKQFREQLNAERNAKAQIQKEVSRLQGQIEGFKRSNSKTKNTQDEIKNLRQQLSTERTAKINIERQNQKLQIELKPLRDQINNERTAKANLQKQVQRIQLELEVVKKSEVQNKKLTGRAKQNQDDLKNVREQLNTEKSTRVNLQRENQKLQIELKPLRQQINSQRAANAQLQKQTQRLYKQVEALKRSETEVKRSTSKLKQNQDEIKNLREQLAAQKQTRTNLQRENQKLQVELKPLREQINNERAANAQYQQERMKLYSQLETFKKSEPEVKRTASKLKQNQDQIINLREQLATEKQAKGNLQKEIQKLMVQLKPLREQINNEKNINAGMQKQIQRLHEQIERLKRSEQQMRRSKNKFKQNEDELNSLMDQLDIERTTKNNLEREYQKLQIEAKPLREQLNHERASKMELQKQLKRMLGEIEAAKKAETQIMKSTIRMKQNEDELKKIKEQLNAQLTKNSAQTQQIQRLQHELQSGRRTAGQLKKMTTKAQKAQQEIKSIREQLSQLRASNNQTTRVNKNLEKQVQTLKGESDKARRLEIDMQNYKRSDVELRKISNRARQVEDELRNTRQELTNEREKISQSHRINRNLENLLEKLKADNERLRSIEILYEQIKINEGEFKRTSQKLKANLDQTRVIREELESERGKNYELSRDKQQLERHIQKLSSQIDMYRKNQTQLKVREHDTLKRFQIEAKNKEELSIQNLRQDIEKIQFDLSYSLESLDRLVKASTAVKPSDELEKIRKQLTSSHHSASRKILPLIEAFIRSNNRSVELESLMDKTTREENERRKKLEADHKAVVNELAELRQNSNSICQALKSAARTWTRTKPEQLFTDNKLIQILESELKKGNHAHRLEQIEFESVAIVESVVNMMLSENAKVEDRYLKIIQSKTREIDRAVSKQQYLTQSDAEKAKKIQQLELQVKNANNGVDQIKRQGLTYVRQIERLMKEHQRVIYEANLQSEQLSKEVEQGVKLNKQVINLKKQITRLTGEKESLENVIKEANQQIARLKKHTQDFVQHERKVLETLQLEGKEKQKFQRQLESLQRSLEKVDKEREYYEKKTKAQDSDILKFRQLEITMHNLVQQNEIKTATFQNSILSRDKELKNLHERMKITIQERDKLQQQIILLEKQLANHKFEADKANRSVKDNNQIFERQKHDFTKQIQRLNLQIKFDIEEKETEKRHFSNIISRLEKNLSDAQAHRVQEVKQIQAKIQLIYKQKEETRKQLQHEQNKYRQKLRQVNRDLELTSNTGERQKMQMKRQIDRLTQELNNIVETSESEKVELRKTIEKMLLQKQKLNQDRIEEKRIFQEEVERAKNQQYQANYQKLKKQREEIRILQEELDKLNEIIDTNEGNYNKIVEDNRQMFDKINELESNQKNYHEQVQMLKDKSVGDLNNAHLQVSRNTELTRHIEKLEAQVKEFEILIASNSREMAFINQQKDRMKELQSKIDEVTRENIKLKVLEEQNLRQLNKFKEENIQLRTENAAIDRELYATKSKPDNSQNQAILLTKYEDMARKYEQVNEQSLKYKLETTNFERLLKEKQLETIKALEIKHLQMEKDMLDNSWKQRMDALNERFKEQTKELEALRVNYDTKKDQYTNDVMNFKIEKDRLDRSLADAERKLGQAKDQINRISRDGPAKQQQKKAIQEKYQALLKNFEDKVKDIERVQNQLRGQQVQSKQLAQQINLKEEAFNRELQKASQIANNKIESLEKQVESKRKLIEQKQLQIRQFITKLSNQSSEKTVMYTEKQMEYQTSALLFERTIEDLRKENERLRNQLDNTTKKLQDKIQEASNLLMELKQAQSDRQLSDQQFKFKIETLTNKINDSIREVQSYRGQLKNNATILQSERQRNREDKEKLERSLNEALTRNRLLEDALQKGKIQKVTLAEREKAMRAQLQAQEDELVKIHEKTTKIQGGTYKIKEQNKYLKQIVHMLDTNYVQDEQEDQNEVKILMKISEQISYLIERNIHLETQLKTISHKSQNNDEQWLSSLQFLIESLLDYLNESELIGHKNVTKFVYSAEFKAESLYDQKEKYMVYVQNFIKELFQNVVSELSENIALYEKSLGDMKKMVESYFNSGDQRFLQSLRKCLKKFDN